MKKAIVILLSFGCLFTGCKKAIQQTQEDLVLLAMTDGQWAITSFTQNGTNITADFVPYKFKYYSNKTVDAIKNGTVEKTGWEFFHYDHFCKFYKCCISSCANKWNLAYRPQ
jgi:hypothetical protein